MRLVHLNEDQLRVFVTLKNVGIIINAKVTEKNRSTKVGEMMDLFGILAYVNVSVINHMMLENI